MKKIVYLLLVLFLFETQTKATSYFYFPKKITEQRNENNHIPLSQDLDSKCDFEEKCESENQNSEDFIVKKTVNCYLKNIVFKNIKNSFFYQKSISSPFLKDISQPPDFN